MPDLSDLVPFHSGQVENYNLLVLGQCKICIKLIIMNSHVALKTVSILISWLLFKVNYYEFKCCIENSVDPDQLASSEAS